MRQTRKAFHWLVDLLHHHKVQFVIFGGFAANIYGSPRKLADIDICIKEEDIYKLLPIFQEHAKTNLKNYRDPNWNTLLITLVYTGQEIDICALEKTNIFNKIDKKWELLSPYLKHPQKIKYLGKTVIVVKRSKLLEYKSKLLRHVDKQDIRYLGHK